MINRIKDSNNRWKLVLLMSAGILINYLDRVNISHALIPISEELKLNNIELGIVLSAFSWGYVLFMFVGGVLVDKIGPKKIATWSATIWSTATALVGISWNFSSIFISRFILGIGEAPIFPANARIVVDEFPINERGRATAIFDAGSYIGTALSAPLIVFLLFYFNWRISFFVCALIGFIWVLIWKKYSSRFSNTSESSKVKTNKISISEIKFLLLNRKVLGASYGFFCYNYSKSFYLTWFPAYLVTERGFDFLAIGFIGMIPPAFAVLAELLSGAISDKMIKLGKSITFSRKLPLVLGMVLASIIVLTEFVDSKYMIIIILSFAFAFTISASPGIWAIPGDIAPRKNLVGTIGGIQNTFSNIAGIVAPIITGLTVEFTGGFKIALILTSCITFTGALSYLFVVGKLIPIKMLKIQ